MPGLYTSYLLHRLSNLKSEKTSETESEEEFYDIENKDVKKEIPVESEMASENKGFTLQVFDGTHYDKWKYKLKLFLEFKECSEVIEHDARPSTIEEVEWKKKEIKAKNYIVNSMTNTQLELIISEETAKKMVAKLDENYLVKSSAVKLLCKRKLLDLKMEESENPTDFYNNFEKLVNELKNAGENVTKEDKLNYFLLTLPESMSHMVDIVDALAEKDKTVEFVKSKLELEFKKKHGESENSRSSAFTFEKRKEDKRTCYVCGSVGNIQYDCPKKNNSSNRGTPQRREGQSRAPQRGGGNGRGYS